MNKTKQVAVAIVAAVLCFAVSCGGTTETTATKSKTSAIKRAKPDPEPVDETGKRWGGWRWRGKRDSCFFVYKNRCYSDKSRACAVAKCGPRKCKHKGGGPAEIYCKK